MNTETSMFIAAIVCGVGALLLWDVLHGLRRVFFKGVILNIILDVFWWLCIGGGFVYYMWQYGSMNLRFFVVFGAVMGAFLYRITLSRLFRKWFYVIFDIIYKIIKFILKILLTPAVFLYKILVVYIFKNFVGRAKRGVTKWRV